MRRSHFVRLHVHENAHQTLDEVEALIREPALVRFAGWFFPVYMMFLGMVLGAIVGHWLGW